MMRPDAKVEKVYLYPNPIDFRNSIDGLAALVELDKKVAVFDPVLFVFLKSLLYPHSFEKMLGRHDIDIFGQTLARWAILCCDHFQPLRDLIVPLDWLANDARG